ncbi:MAG: hypothetical protein DRJ40_00685 [Thermoprotei archaeon]|nr:MAG: hypothetical protein DRJ40_00685 [Thermoprotei archaeon]
MTGLARKISSTKTRYLITALLFGILLLTVAMLYLIASPRLAVHGEITEKTSTYVTPKIREVEEAKKSVVAGKSSKSATSIHVMESKSATLAGKVFVYRVLGRQLTLRINNVTVVATGKDSIAQLYVSIVRIRGKCYINCTLVVKGLLWFSNHTSRFGVIKLSELLPPGNAFYPVIELRPVIRFYKVYLCRPYAVMKTEEYKVKGRIWRINVTLYRLVKVNETFITGRAYAYTKVYVSEGRAVEELYWYSNMSLITRREAMNPVIIESINRTLSMLNLKVLRLLSYRHNYEPWIPQPLATLILINETHGMVYNIVLPGAPTEIGYPEAPLKKLKLLPISKLCEELGIVHPYIELHLVDIRNS